MNKTIIIYDKESCKLVTEPANNFNNNGLSQRKRHNEMVYRSYILDDKLDANKLMSYIKQLEKEDEIIFDSFILCVNNDEPVELDNNDGAARNNNNNRVGRPTFRKGKFNHIIKALLDYLRAGIKKKLDQIQKYPNQYPYPITPKRFISPKLGIVLVTDEELDAFSLSTYVESSVEVELPFLLNAQRLKGLDIVPSSIAPKELNNRFEDMLRDNVFHWNYEIIMPKFAGSLSKDSLYPAVPFAGATPSTSWPRKLLYLLALLVLAALILFGATVVLHDTFELLKTEQYHCSEAIKIYEGEINRYRDYHDSQCITSIDGVRTCNSPAKNTALTIGDQVFRKPRQSPLTTALLSLYNQMLAPIHQRFVDPWFTPNETEATALPLQ